MCFKNQKAIALLQDNAQKDTREVKNQNKTLKTELENFKTNLSMKLDNYNHEKDGLSRELQRYQDLTRVISSNYGKSPNLTIDVSNKPKHRSRYLSPSPLCSKTIAGFPNLSFKTITKFK